MLVGKTPWNAKSQYELIKNIETEPVNFNFDIKISEESKNFIKMCLKIEESQRIGWDDIYKHPAFQEFFGEFN